MKLLVMTVFVLVTTSNIIHGYFIDKPDDDTLWDSVLEQHEPLKDDQSFPILSSFELYSVTDLLLEITVRPCALVNRPVMESMKKFFAAGLSHAPQQPGYTQQHAQFYPTYHALVNCLSHVDEAYSKTKKTIQAPTQKPQRAKRDISMDNSLVDNPQNKSNHLAHHEFLEELSIIEPSLSFEEFFTLVVSITDQVCSKEMGGDFQLPIEFLVPLLSEVSYWAKTQGASVYKTAQVKYFHNTFVIDELQKCDRKLRDLIQEYPSTTTKSPKKPL